MHSHIKPKRLSRLPEDIRRELISERRKRGLSQATVGKRVGLPQMHVSGIETGRIVPRFDTLLDLVRVLDHDLLMVPRALVPAVEALIRDHRSPSGDGEQPLYSIDIPQDRPDED